MHFSQKARALNIKINFFECILSAQAKFNICCGNFLIELFSMHSASVDDQLNTTTLQGNAVSMSMKRS